MIAQSHTGLYVPVDANETGAGIHDRLYKPDGRTPLVVWFHGHAVPDDVARVILTDTPGITDSAWALKRAGYPVFAGDFGENSWGHAGAVSEVGSGLDWGQSNPATTAEAARYGMGARPGPAHLVAGSAGIFPAARFAHENPERVLSLTGMIAPPDLADLHDRNYAGYAAEIEAAFGGLAGYLAALPDANPMAYAADLRHLPIHLIASNDDPAAPAALTEAFAELAGATVTWLGNVGHTTTGMNLDQLVAFVAANDP